MADDNDPIDFLAYGDAERPRDIPAFEHAVFLPLHWIAAFYAWLGGCFKRDRHR